MAPAFANILTRFRNFWSGISLSQKIFLSGLTLVAVGIFFGLIYYLNRPDYRVLYSNLSLEDANRIVSILQNEKLNYKLENNGTTVLVPEDSVYDMRLKIAGEGNLVGQGIGFEIFDAIKVGQTDFVQKINYQRALQGELTRTITEFPAVENARVHLVIPQKSLFIEEQMKPSASVVLKIAETKKVEPKDVQAIVNLLVMSIEGLEPSRISIADTSGKVLYYPDDENSLSGLSSSQLELKMSVQSNYERRIEEMLSRVIGPGKVIARVNADLDFSQRTIRREMYDPNTTVVRSEQRTEEATRGQSTLDASAPDPNLRGDGISGGLSDQQGSRETRSTNYEINREEQNIIAPVGDMNRLTIAVIVDGTYEQNAAGEFVFTPRSEEELARIRQLVANAVGFDSSRGDTIEISSISFGTPDIEIEQSLADVIMDYAMRLGKPILNALLVFLFLLMIVRPIVLALIRPKVKGDVLEGLEGLPQGTERLALIEADEEMEAIDGMKKIDDIKAHTIQMAEQNMEQAVGILRGWLKTNEGGGRSGSRAAA